MKIINFNANYNNKLNCICFSTIRIADVNKYRLNEKYSICLDKGFLFNAKLVSIENTTLKLLTERDCLLDANLTKQEFMKLINELYPNQDKSFYTILTFKKQLL